LSRHTQYEDACQKLSQNGKNDVGTVQIESKPERNAKIPSRIYLEWD